MTGIAIHISNLSSGHLAASRSPPRKCYRDVQPKLMKTLLLALLFSTGCYADGTWEYTFSIGDYGFSTFATTSIFAPGSISSGADYVSSADYQFMKSISPNFVSQKGVIFDITLAGATDGSVVVSLYGEDEVGPLFSERDSFLIPPDTAGTYVGKQESQQGLVGTPVLTVIATPEPSGLALVGGMAFVIVGLLRRKGQSWPFSR